MSGLPLIETEKLMLAGGSGLAAEVRKETVAALKLSWPLVLGFLGQNLLGMVDTAMVGRLGATELAGVAIGNGLFFSISVLGMGLVVSLDPIVSQAVGAGEGARARAALSAGIKLGLWSAVPMLLLLAVVPLLLPFLGISQEIAREAQAFTWARAPGAVPFVVAMALRSYLQARGATLTMLWGALAANIVNAILNYWLIFGEPRLGLPALGVVGSGLASAVATLVQLGVLFLVLRRLPHLSGEGDTDVPLRKLVSIGLPISITLLAEVGGFTIAGLLAGTIGPEAASGHQVAIQLASFSFMVSLAIANATTVRVGQAVGRGDSRGVGIAGGVGLGLSMVYMASTAILFLLAPGPLASILSNQTEVIAIAVPLIHIAAAFQLFDGAQVVAAGALRGLGETKSAQHANLFGYYALGLPVAGLLAFGLGWREQGLWWGLCLGLAVVALVLVLRFYKLSQQPIERV